MSEPTVMELLRLILCIQRKNKFVERAYDTNLSLLEAHILVDLHTETSLTPGELSKRLHINKSMLSNRLHTLLEQGYILRSQCSRDRRRSILSLSSFGRRHLTDYHEQAERRLLMRVSDLDEGERETTVLVLRRFADAYGASPMSSSDVLSPLRLEIIRVTRELGLLTSSAFGMKDCSALELQVLHLIHESSFGISAKTLCENLSCKSSTLSVLLSKLDKKGLLTRKTALDDKRWQYLSLSSKGITLLHHRLKRAVESIARVLTAWSADEVQALIDALKRIAGEKPFQGEHPLLTHLTLTELRSEEHLQEARQFLLHKYYALDPSREVPSIFLDASSSVFALYDETGLRGFIEISNTQECAILNHLVFQNLATDILSSVIDCALSLFQRKEEKPLGIHHRVLTDSSLPQVIIESLSQKLVQTSLSEIQ